MPRQTKAWVFKVEFRNEDELGTYLASRNVSKKPFRSRGQKQSYRCCNWTKYKCKFEVEVRTDGATRRVFESEQHEHNDEHVKPKYGVDKERLDLLDEV